MQSGSAFSPVGAVLVIGLVFGAGHLAARQPGPDEPPAQWTVMVYMSGDNDLEPYIVNDIENELAPTGSTAAVQVLALADRATGYDIRRGDWRTTKLFHVTQGMTANAASAVADWGERNFGDPQTLIDFVTWSKANYPAENYVLYFWGHGWSWHPGWVMFDETDDDTLDVDEVKAALPALGFIDVVGYDGCNMASIEIDALWHGHATALSHSQEWVSGEGLKYDQVLAQLAADPAMTADEVAILTTLTATTDKTWSAVAVDERLDPLLAVVDQWSIALRDGLTVNRPAYKTAFDATQSFVEAPMDKDLFDMALKLKSNVSDAGIQAQCQAVMDAVEAVVLAERHQQPRYNDAHGITIYHPSNTIQKTDFQYYRTIDFALQNHWDEFLCAYVPQMGDVDLDGDVDLSDLAMLLGAYGACIGDPAYLASADFDHSGCIDLADISTLLSNYGA